jgi:transposase
MPRTPTQLIDVTPDELEAVLRRAQESLDPADYELTKAIFESYQYLGELVDDKNTSIARLRRLMFGRRTEKTAQVVGHPAKGSGAEAKATEPDSAETTAEQIKPKSKPKPGHGRHGADAYQGGDQIEVPHATLKAGDPCPQCQKGTLYDSTPGVIVRVVGRAPLYSRVYRLQKLRCRLCDQLYTAKPPDGVGSRKYDATAASMIALLRYGNGMPFNRLDGRQRNLKIPLPASTQWEIVEQFAATLYPTWQELISQAADGEVLHNDDTTVKILDLMGERAQPGEEATGEKSSGERRGLFTSGVVSLKGERRVALFFSGRQHAGENLADVLRQRNEELSTPIQMCDALSRNLPGELKTIVSNCLAHARRQFVEIHDRFPEECAYVLEAFCEVYATDAKACERGLSAKERLKLHQRESEPKMKELQRWLTEQSERKKVEPNSALGGAIGYLRNHWEKLTLFLREEGAPLDNNICERALKKAILHRKNSLFYKSEKGARVGDVYMSVIHTCELNEVNALEYLVAIHDHAGEVAAEPGSWLPWNYRDKLSSVAEGRQGAAE